MPVTIRHTETGQFAGGFKFTPEGGPAIDRFDLEFDGHYAITEAPADSIKAPIMSTLRDVELGVCAVIETFSPEF